MSFDEAVAGTRERLLHAVRIRLRSDVPLAFCMSGGVDSNTLISIAKKIFDYDVHGFTIINTDPRYDEREMVDASIKALNIRHTQIPTDTTGFLHNLRQLIRQHDAPVYTISYYAHWLLMQSIANMGYRVSLSGTAADELFSGYFDHHLMYLYELRNDPELYEAAKRDWIEKIRPIVRNRYLQDPDLFIKDPAFRDYIFLDANIFQQYLRHVWSEPFTEEKYTDDLLRNRMLNELFHESVPVILHEDDLNSMYFSIENRSPFLDRTLFEFCATIPTRHLIRRGVAKAILREAMRGIVPDVILDEHRKVGFNAPIFDFLDIRDPEVREEILRPSPIYDLVKIEMIEKLLEKQYLPNSESKFLFNFLNAKIFLEEFDNN
jgi:asparagine synthase (glutamine-hydrolysing)